MKKITPYLWFEKDAGEAMKFYTSVFKNAKILDITKLPEGTPGADDGDVITGKMEIEGQEFFVLNGGPQFKFNESVSFFVDCEDQDEVDYYWEKLTADGGQESMCGWLKDKYGLSWQIIPRTLGEYMSSDDREKAVRAMQAMLKMNKIIVADLKKAFDGE